jgi:sugar lactone lactonase YvrE
MLRPLHLVPCLVAAACASTPPDSRFLPLDEVRLERVATSDRRWTGVAVAEDGRVFVNFPRWGDSQPFAVGELGPDGTTRPWPDERWNGWSEGDDPRDRFVCVQALLCDEFGRLWVLDPANPRFEGVVEGGPKLVCFDLASGRRLRSYAFAAPAITPDSYLNDVRIDHAARRAYLTDSGDGALVVLDLDSGRAERLLDDHPSTQAQDVELVIGGEPWLRDGATPRVHADGIALDLERGTLYWQALTGRTLYALSTAVLGDPRPSAGAIAGAVRAVAEVGPSDGILFGPDGAVYLTSLEEDAIRRLWPDEDRIQTVVGDPRIAWPDTLAVGPDGALWFTTAQIHRGDDPPEPYGLWRIVK